MCYFLKQIFVFFFCVYGLMFGLRLAVPYYYANPIYLEKFNYLDKTDADHDLVFMGSSRTFRQIAPRKIDEEMGGDIRSFNLGAGGTFGLEVLYAAEQLLSKRDTLPKMRVLVIEIQLPQPITDTNLRAARSKYYVDFKRYRSADDFFSSYYTLSEADLHMRNYRNAWLERALNIGLIRSQIFSLIGRGARNVFLGNEGSGYVPLDEEIHKRSYYERRRDFVENLETYVNEFYVRRGRKLETVDIGDVYLKQHLDLIEMGLSKGIRVIFMLLPSGFQLSSSGPEAIYAKLPEESRIDVGSQESWPMLYNPNLYFDRGHLNKSGAELLSKILGRELYKHLNYVKAPVEGD